MLADPLKQLVYRKLGVERKRPPNTLLISNFLTPPTIDSIDLSGHAGHAGRTIQILAIDTIEVVDVTVRIRDLNGAAIESGSAAKDHGMWIYRTTANVVANQSDTWRWSPATAPAPKRPRSLLAPERTRGALGGTRSRRQTGGKSRDSMVPGSSDS